MKMQFPTTRNSRPHHTRIPLVLVAPRLIALILGLVAIAVPLHAEPQCFRSEDDVKIAQQFLPPGAGPDLCALPLDDERLLVVLYPFRENGSRSIGALLLDTVTRRPVAHAREELGIEADSVASMEFLQIDGVGHPEVIAHLPVGVRDVGTWILRWDGTTVENLTPRESDGFTKLVGFHEFVDIDHDGQLEIISWEEGWPQVYDLDDTGFTDEPEPCAFISPYERHTSEPTVEKAVITAPPGTYVLTVTNGTGPEESRVTAGEILIDGKVIINPGDFKRKETVLSKEIALASISTLTISLRGQPGSMIAIRICQPAR